jgi:uncharacterized protein YdeI (BOF family)
MKKICILILAISALTGVFSSIAQAKPYHHTTVEWVVANRNNLDVDDDYVTLVGHVTRRMGDEEYWFTDGTGSVRLDSENFDLPIGTRILVGGRIDQAYLGFGHLEVDVRRWHYAPLTKRPVAMRPPVTRPVQAAAAPTPAPAPVSVSAPAPAPVPATTPAPAEATPATPALSPPSEPAPPATTTTTTSTTTTMTPTSSTPSSSDMSGTNATSAPGK